MANSIFVGRGTSISTTTTGIALVAHATWNHGDILVGATPKTILLPPSGYAAVPIGLAVQRPVCIGAGSSYSANASFSLIYAGIPGTLLITVTPQLTTLGTKYYAYESRSGGAFNGNLTPADTALNIVSTNNSGGSAGLTILTFDLTYLLVPNGM